MQPQVNLEDLDIKELKVLAYDTFAEIQKHQQNLQIINQVISQKSKEKIVHTQQLEE